VTKAEPCPKHACGFWGVPLEKVESLENLSEDKYECCLWDELKEKCSRDPRFVADPAAKDYFDPADDELQEGIECSESDILEGTQPSTERGGNRSEIKDEEELTSDKILDLMIEHLSPEELCKLTDIQPHLVALQSKDREKIKSALGTLSTITRLTDRKDALDAMVGYYRTDARTIDEIVDFFHDTGSVASSIDLFVMVLKDLVKFKDLGSRRRLFTHDFLSDLNVVLRHSDITRKSEVRTLIENSAWGEKLKRKFIDALFYREF